MKSYYFLVYGIKPVESYDIDDINFIKKHFHTDNVTKLNKKQFDNAENLYITYISELCQILNKNK